MSDLVYPRAEFESDETRRRSPEWDYGVHWMLNDFGPEFPRYRLSWIVETGELYAVADAGPTNVVYVLGKIEKVGDYPYPGQRDHLRGNDLWQQFSNQQDVEQVLDGWATQSGSPLGPPSLDWVRRRIAERRPTLKVVQ